MADMNVDKKDTIKTPNGNDLKAVEKKNIFQKAGDGIQSFCDKHQKGVKWAKRGLLAAGGALLFGAGCKLGSRSSNSDSDVPTDAEFIDTEEEQYSTTDVSSEE